MDIGWHKMSGKPIISKIEYTNNNLDYLQSQIEQLQAENATLREEIENIKNRLMAFDGFNESSE